MNQEQRNEFQGIIYLTTVGGVDYSYGIEQRDFMVDALRQAESLVKSHDEQNVLHPNDTYTLVLL